MSDDSVGTKRKESEGGKRNKSKKVAASSSEDSGPDDLAPVRPSPKKAKVEEQKEKPKKGLSNVEEEASFLLSKNKFVKVRTYHGQVLIDIREFYLNSDGELKPGKKGISINAAQWDQLKAIVTDVDAAIKERI